ncbi:hypothetical protein BDY17DRAFT_310132 [Neohortaea acidophila]|uniref:Uncharacterized protein n=1 Tax=Neohortaea acidophila TaxID=245834 RepID=A0A6A6PSI3_9PEZI|nr:uncharacterized protein BDY17DRAFT_310132 [Neohortaea acidophila]KAF2483059.1 hypothetical protein BDY17DRAFT_310132 [Neohortaea acidophila]
MSMHSRGQRAEVSPTDDGMRRFFEDELGITLDQPLPANEGTLESSTPRAGSNDFAGYSPSVFGLQEQRMAAPGLFPLSIDPTRIPRQGFGNWNRQTYQPPHGAGERGYQRPLGQDYAWPLNQQGNASLTLSTPDYSQVASGQVVKNTTSSGEHPNYGRYQDPPSGDVLAETWPHGWNLGDLSGHAGSDEAHGLPEPATVSHHPAQGTPLPGPSTQTEPAARAGSSPPPAAGASGGRMCIHEPCTRKGHPDYCSRHVITSKRHNAPPPQLEYLPLTKEAALEVAYAPYPGLRQQNHSMAADSTRQGEWVQRLLAAAQRVYQPSPEDTKKKIRYMQKQQKMFWGYVAVENKAGERYNPHCISARMIMLFHAVVALHDGGPVIYPHGGDSHGYGKLEALTFEQRLEKIEGILKTHKRIVMDAFEGKGVVALVETPEAYRKRKEQNQQSNDKKEPVLKGKVMGKAKSKAAGKRPVTDEDVVHSESEEESAASMSERSQSPDDEPVAGKKRKRAANTPVAGPSKRTRSQLAKPKGRRTRTAQATKPVPEPSLQDTSGDLRSFALETPSLVPDHGRPSGEGLGQDLFGELFESLCEYPPSEHALGSHHS